MKKKLLSLLLAACMVLAMMPGLTLTASAVESYEITVTNNTNGNLANNLATQLSGGKTASDITKLTITGSMNAIDFRWLRDNLSTNIIEIDISGVNLTTLPNDAFCNLIGYAGGKYNNLVSVVLPSGLSSIGDYAFSNCTKLVLTVLPSDLSSIGGYAFSNCTKLALNELPSGLTSIGESAFDSCINLALNELPSGLTSIGGSAFANCTNLALTALPSGLTSISSSAFLNCTNLKLTTLPSGLSSIGDYAFYGCTSLLEVIKCDFTNKLSGITTQTNTFSSAGVKYLLCPDDCFDNSDTQKTFAGITAINHSGDIDNDGADNITEYNNSISSVYLCDIFVTLSYDSSSQKVIASYKSSHYNNITVTPSTNAYTITYNGRNSTTYNSTTAPTASGDYTATFELTTAGNDAYAISSNSTLTVAYKILSQSGVTVQCDDVVYGNDITPSITNSTGGTQTIEYKVKGASDDTYSTTLPKDVGQYTVRVSEAATTTHTAGSATCDFAITKKPITVTVIVENKQYDGLNNATISSANLNGIVGTDQVSLSTPIPTGTFTSVDVANGIIIDLNGDFVLEGAGAKNYQLTQPTDVKANIYNNFNATKGSHYTVTTPDGDNGWFTSDNFVVTATSGHLLSLTNTDDGTWSQTLPYSDDIADGQVTFYIRDIQTKAITTQTTESYKIDKTAPTGEITMKTKQWTSFLNTITFGAFFKNTADVSITGADTTSGVAKIEYQKLSSEADYDENANWTLGSSFSVQSNEKFIVYARITDNVGNIFIFNSDGVIVYSDSEQSTESISFTKTSTTDINADVTLNDNTINEIKNGMNTLVKDTDYTISGGIITFKASYLDSLAVGDYTLTVSYNPMGESYQDASDNETPATTSIALTVSKATSTNNPKTGYTSLPNAWLFAIALASGTAYIVLGRKRKLSCK